MKQSLKKDIILLSPDSINAAAHYVPFQYRKNGEITERILLIMIIDSTPYS